MRCFVSVLTLFFVAILPGCIGDERLDVPGPEIETCREWLKSNLDDPHWDEVEWETPMEDEGRTGYYLKIRTRSPEGGKVLKRFHFLIRHGDGRLLHAQEVENF